MARIDVIGIACGDDESVVRTLTSFADDCFIKLATAGIGPRSTLNMPAIQSHARRMLLAMRSIVRLVGNPSDAGQVPGRARS